MDWTCSSRVTKPLGSLAVESCEYFCFLTLEEPMQEQEPQPSAPSPAHPALAKSTRSSARPLEHKIAYGSVDVEPARSMAEYTVPAQDAHGHSARINFRVPPTMKGEVEAVLATKVFPWKNESGLMRWALWRALRHVNTVLRDPQQAALIPLLDGWVASCRVQEEHAKYKEVLEHVQRVVQGLLKDGAVGPARKIVKRIADEVSGIEDEHWREKYQQEVVERFAGVMK